MNTIYLNEKKQEKQRTKCQIYTRVMGYHRPVISFNIGKKSEFYSRSYFKQNNSSELFIDKYIN